MKILEKFVLILYSLLILIISSITCLLIFRIIEIENITEWIQILLQDPSLSIIAIGVSVVCILLSIKCIFFRKRKEIKKSVATDILLENETGRLLISKRAIENTVRNIINDVMTNSPETKVTIDIDPANNLSIYISILIDTNRKVRDVTVGLQMKIKDKIKEDFELNVKQVNIKVDSIEKQENKKEIENKEENSQKNINENKTDVIEGQKGTVE